MTMNARAQVVLAKKSGLPRDEATNTWHFFCNNANPAGTNLTNISTRLGQFYIDSELSFAESVSTAAGAHLIKSWDLTGAGTPLLLGPPDHTYTFQTAANGASSLPDEVAAVLTLEANSGAFSEEVGSTRPAARHRGRIYLGPIANQQEQDATTKEIYLGTVLRTRFLDAMQTMVASLATDNIEVGVFSRVDNVVRPITSYSMDDAFDIIRKRGVKARSRTRRTV